MSDLEPGVQLAPDTIAAMERLSTLPTTKHAMNEHHKQWQDAARNCLLDLRARVEALEATQHAHIEGSPDRCLEIHEYRPAMPTTPSPAGSLVERVATAMHPDSFSPEESWGTEARAAICEVAAWLRTKGYGSWVELQREATR